MAASIISLLFAYLVTSKVDVKYGSDTDVIELTDSNFQPLVMDSNDVWIVEFFKPGCGYCTKWEPVLLSVATKLKGVVKVGVVDAAKHASVTKKYKIHGVPDIKIFGANKKVPTNYRGRSDAEGLMDAAQKEVRRMVSLNGSNGYRNNSESEVVVELTGTNFEDLVMNSEDVWMVVFYSLKCVHCHRLDPEWKKAAKKLKGRVKLGSLDGTIHTDWNEQYNITGFPTILYFPAGPKRGVFAEEYKDNRTATAIATWALRKLHEDVPPPAIVQLTSTSVMKDLCENHVLCVVGILPYIRDCQSQCRNAYIKSLRDVGNKFRKHDWGWGWTETMAQSRLEDVLRIDVIGVIPAMVIINVRKMYYCILKGPFTYDGISEFVSDLLGSSGKCHGAPVKGGKLPELVETERWNGEDFEIPEGEEFGWIDYSLEDDDEKHIEL